MAAIVSALLRLIWPQAPAWLAPLLVELVPEIVALVREVRDSRGKLDPDHAIVRASRILDASLDQAPGLADWTEAERDALIAHLVGIARVVAQAEGGGVTLQPRDIRGIKRAIRAARKGA